MRDQLPKDFEGTLAKVHADGYTVVEAAGYYDRTAEDFRKAMDKAGLRCVSTHHALDVLETQLDKWIEYGQTLGLEYIVCSSSGGMHRDPAKKGPPTLDDWHWIAGEFNRIGEKVKAAGMTFGVHNHTPEFAVIDGVTGVRRTAAAYRSQGGGLRDGRWMGVRCGAQSGGLPEQDAETLPADACEGHDSAEPMAKRR